jgi:hypothetical protein
MGLGAKGPRNFVIHFVWGGLKLWIYVGQYTDPGVGGSGWVGRQAGWDQKCLGRATPPLPEVGKKKPDTSPSISQHKTSLIPGSLPKSLREPISHSALAGYPSVSFTEGADHGIADWGVSQTSLEDVFLNIVSLTERENLLRACPKGAISLSSSLQQKEAN